MKFLSSLILLCVCISVYAQDHLFFSPSKISALLDSYNAEERGWIARDLTAIRGVCMGDQQKRAFSQPPRYIATAGGPGARKTTILERFLHSHPEYAHVVYVDPDQRALKFMLNTYISRSLNAYECAKSKDYDALLKQAYEKWRWASNYIALTLMEEAFAQQRDVAYGTTSTGAITAAFLQSLKKAGYRITLLLCSCEDDVWKEAIRYRNQIQKFYQSTPEDAVEKGKLFALRVPDYFEYADEIHIFWSDTLYSPERLAATVVNGKQTIHDQEALDHVIDKYQRDCLIWQKEGVSLPAFPIR